MKIKRLIKKGVRNNYYGETENGCYVDLQRVGDMFYRVRLFKENCQKYLQPVLFSKCFDGKF